MKNLKKVAVTTFIAAMCFLPAVNSAVTLLGAGASFPYPLISKWSYEYNKLNPDIQVSYQSIGSGGGIKQITARTVDFGASDAPLAPEERKAAPGLLHIPITLGAVVLAYDVPGVKGLKLSGEVIVDIFMGEIKRWDDPAIKALNPQLNLPARDIVVVHRSDGSGTTFVFSDYLSTISKDWNSKVGKGKALNWPTGIGAKGNEGVSGMITQLPYSIGYIELTYALQNGIEYATVRNKEGRFVQANTTTIKSAASAVKLPKGNDDWSNVSIVNAPGNDSYPISTFSYVLVYERQNDRIKGITLVEFLTWVIKEGQSYAEALHYVPLPSEVVKLNEETIKMVKY
jgi:phosphate ABC transporter phosphate-binding protein